ncbi:hypothetical protein [Halovivax ruber]|uniref:hypothetical protein n=1 Tax=Halovivax ruber TaxID=387341 RepID=UPI0011E50D2E|nr:hypothetical protein [Halovivax ruber]
MSVETDRDLGAELASPRAGHRGIPVDAICTGCQTVHVKRVRPSEVTKTTDADPVTLDARALTSFKHVCYRCQTATWWNPTAVLSGLVETERAAEEDR